MAGLVADYGSDSESDDSSSSFPVTENVLPKPNFEAKCDDTVKEKSVFINPFAEADKAEKAILEKHVKMISVDVKTVNGKKICWNHRKNKCRFGHNCKYAHDSDLQIDKSLIVPIETNVKQVNPKEFGGTCEVEASNRKKRPGMAQGIVPSRKIMKLYKKHKEQDTK